MYIYIKFYNMKLGIYVLKLFVKYYRIDVVLWMFLDVWIYGYDDIVFLKFNQY